ncbi:MAG: DUF1573 domain-containing protein [Planctomycetota bacterium]
MTAMIMTLVLLFGVSSACPARNAQEAPKLKVEESHVQLGTIFEGSRTSHVFKLENVGSAALTLRRIKSHCRCATSTLKIASAKEEITPDLTGAFSADSLPSIAPGAAAELHMTLNTEGFLAHEYRKTLRIISNDPDVPEFELVIYFTVELPATADPKRLDFGTIPRGQTSTLSTTLTIHEDKKFSFVGAAIMDGMTADLEALEVGDAPRAWLLTVTATASLPVGKFIAPIKVTTDDPEIKEIQLQAYGEVLSPLRFTPGDGEERVLVIGAVEPTQGATKTITVENIEPEKPLAITEVKIEGMREGQAEARLRTIKEGVSYEIDVSILPGQKPRPFTGNVVVFGEGLEKDGHRIRFRGVLR